ncbi:MAG: cell wall hydrolase [Roseburia sp.]|nr:cell wall hydrolase [Roseburia sp.]
MYKKATSILLLIYGLLLLAFFCVKGLNSLQPMSRISDIGLTDKLAAGESCSTLGIANVTASGQRVVDFQTIEKELAYQLEEEELEVLLKIVEAEAGGEDEDGRLLVANVVLNRMNDEQFPDTVSEVVYQRYRGVSQFSPVASGRINKVEVSEETVLAVERALEGEDISQGALYFAARKYAGSSKMKWFDEHLTFLFEHGGHEFFK